MLKKMFALFLSVIMAVSCLGGIVYADGIAPRYSYTNSCSSTLTISGSTATCESEATGYYGETTKIVISQTLQKYNSSTGKWSDVASWRETDTGYHGSATYTKSGLSSGSYRIEAEFYVYAGSNYEQITIYSDIKSV